MADTNEIKLFYDSKVQQKNSVLTGVCGSENSPLYLRAPYLFVENYLQAKNEYAGEKLRLLDLCCGTGVHAVKFAKLGYTVCGVDVSPLSIEKAKILAKEFNVAERITFMTDEIDWELDFPDGSFDVVFISGSLYYLNFAKIIPEILRILKKQGLFICIETNGSNFIINFIRKVKNMFLGYRDQRTISNLLRLKDVKKISQLLSSSELKYFGFLTLLSCLLSWNNWLLEKWVKLALSLDDFFLNKLKLRVLGFKFVIISKK